ncbi:MAG: hypothetical protein KAG28_05505 [Cocleimonas sp.]|nr:hypothetical protein [Cocleimonas sp.]
MKRKISLFLMFTLLFFYSTAYAEKIHLNKKQLVSQSKINKGALQKYKLNKLNKFRRAKKQKNRNRLKQLRKISKRNQFPKKGKGGTICFFNKAINKQVCYTPQCRTNGSGKHTSGGAC